MPTLWRASYHFFFPSPFSRRNSSPNISVLFFPLVGAAFLVFSPLPSSSCDAASLSLPCDFCVSVEHGAYLRGARCVCVCVAVSSLATRTVSCVSGCGSNLRYTLAIPLRSGEARTFKGKPLFVRAVFPLHSLTHPHTPYSSHSSLFHLSSGATRFSVSFSGRKDASSFDFMYAVWAFVLVSCNHCSMLASSSL